MYTMPELTWNDVRLNAVDDILDRIKERRRKRLTQEYEAKLKIVYRAKLKLEKEKERITKGYERAYLKTRRQYGYRTL